MFECELENPEVLKTSFNAISNIIEEVQIQIDSEGIRLNAIDRSHISFVKLELDEDLFTEYTCDNPTSINIDTSELMRVLKRAKNSDRVILGLDESNMRIVFEGESSRTFKIRLVGDHDDNPNLPVLEYPARIQVPFGLLKDAVKDLDLFSDKIKLNITPEFLQASAGGDFGDASLEYVHGEEVDCNVQSTYSLEKVAEMLKADKFSDVMEVCLGDDMPLKIIMERVTGDARISFLLAPRLEEE